LQAQERETELVEVRGKLDETQTLLKEKATKFEKSKALIKEKMKEIQRQQALVVDLEAKLAEALQQGSQQTISMDSQQISGLEMQIEQLEQDNSKLRSQISRLTEGISEMEERRSSLERQKNLLGAKIDEQEREHSANEDELMQRLTSLTQHDEVVERKLQETADENAALSEQLADLRHEHEVLGNKFAALQEEMKQLETSSSSASELELQVASLQKQLEVAETEARATKQDFEKQLKAKHTEVDDLEAELSSQLQKVEDEKKVLQEELEKTGEKNTELQDEIVRLKEQVHGLEQIRAEWERDLTWMRMQNDNFTHETDDLRVQMLQYQTELDDLKHTNETLQASHEHEVNALKQQLVDMESMNRLAQLSQHQTDDQVILQNENLKLKATLAEKEEEIRQQRSSEIAGLQQRIQSLEHQLGHANQELLRVQSQLQEVASESLKKDAQLEEQNQRHHAEIRELQHLIAARDAELQSSQQIVVQMQEICETKNDEIGKLRSLTHTPEPAMLLAKAPVATLVQQTREDYVHDLEERTRKLNIMHDDYLQQLQEKTRVIEELHGEIRHYEQRIEQLEAAHRRVAVSRDEPDEQRKAPQIASFFTAADPSATSVFDQQLFGAAPSPFDSWGQPVQEQAVVQKSVKSQATGKPKEEDLKKKVEELQQQLQALQAQHEAALRDLNDRNARIEGLEKQVLDYQRNLQKTPVLEQTVVKKDAYLCYPEQDHKETQTAVEVATASTTPEDPRVAALEAQLREIQHELDQRTQKLDKLNKLVFEYREKIDSLEAELAAAKPKDEPMTAASFFGGVTSEFDQQFGGQPVTEPDCVAKKPYLCYDDKDTQTSFEEEQPAVVEEVVTQQNTAAALFAERPQETPALQTKVEELEAQLRVQMAQHAETRKELDRRNKKLEKLNKMVFDYQTKIDDLQGRLDRQIAANPPQTEEQQKVVSTLNTAQFFGEAPDGDAAFAGREPVSEEWIVPKKAYDTFPDEGWGLDGDELILEEQHHQQQSMSLDAAPRLPISPSVEAELKLREKEDRIAELEQLLGQSDQQSTDLGKKVEKLMKKLKEYKLRLAECQKGFRKSSSVESNELDLAIQEELKKQVAGLEAKVKEHKTELEKVQAEKEALAKRNDVLGSANDRMTEMKERQDQQMELYQARVKELNAKLEKLESWGDEEPVAEKPAPAGLPPTKPQPELESQIRDLQVDNEEFQALLEEEKANNEILESRIRQFQVRMVSKISPKK
jgi:golgin subfamily B member 1